MSVVEQVEAGRLGLPAGGAMTPRQRRGWLAFGAVALYVALVSGLAGRMAWEWSFLAAEGVEAAVAGFVVAVWWAVCCRGRERGEWRRYRDWLLERDGQRGRVGRWLDALDALGAAR